MQGFEDELPSSRVKEIFELLLNKYRYHAMGALIALFLFGLIVFFLKGGFGGKDGDGKVEVLSASSSGEIKTVTGTSQELVVEISGEVEKPGVYHFSSGARIDDLLGLAGGVTENADSVWMAKNLNRAAKLIDGQKLYIPAQSNEKPSSPEESNSQSSTLTAKELTTAAPTSDSRTINSQASNGLININTASLSELDSLPGIGPVYAQKMIDHRPCSDISELKSKKVVPNATFEKIKEKITAN